MGYVPDKKYKITTPKEVYGDLYIEERIVEWTFKNKEDTFGELSPHQQNLALGDLYTVWEDEYSNLMVLKIKDNYKIEEI